MCRFLAYHGVPIYLEDLIASPSHSLIAQSLHATEGKTEINGDGFGLGWYGERETPGLFRDLRPAWSDENLRAICQHVRSGLFFAHVRAATGTAVTRQNCHPFACGRWMFMHNGFVGSWNRLRRKVEQLIPDALYPSRLGTTDSEAVFLAMLGAGLDRDPIGATARVLRNLRDLVNEDGKRERMRFTTAIANGRDLYAFRFAENDAANTLYFRESAGQVVVVSEPFDKEDDWTEIPEGHVLVARASAPVEIVPLHLTVSPVKTPELPDARRINARN
jgi:glutamine amidotransferase